MKILYLPDVIGSYGGLTEGKEKTNIKINIPLKKSSPPPPSPKINKS